MSDSNDAYGLLPYDVIVSAVYGDSDAINKVVKRYEGYICRLASKQIINSYGKQITEIDEELRQGLISQLMIKILSFRV